MPVEGGWPKPAASADSSLAKRIQQAFPDAHVVKALNTMNNQVMADPSLVPGDHVVFLSGDDVGAKQRVRAVLASFGWRDVQMMDLGGIDTAAGPEMMMSVVDGGHRRAGHGRAPLQLGASTRTRHNPACHGFEPPGAVGVP